MTLDPVSVEITYGIERIVLALQGKDSAWDIDWLDGVSYGDVMFKDEVEHCRYYFDVADVDALKSVYDTYEREYARALEGDALISAYDYVLKCSHLFNVLDTRGAIGVTERANYFRRMREMTRTIAQEYVAQREALGYPLMKMADKWRGSAGQTAGEMPPAPTKAADVLIEIGVEEMPADDVADALEQMKTAAPALFDDLRLVRAGLELYTTPRRIVVIARQVAPRQADEEFIAKGPPANRAYDSDGQPTRATIGFARGKGVDISDLVVKDLDGGRYVTAVVRNQGQPATETLAEALPGFVAGLKFRRSMRWNQTSVAYSRPIRWIVALFGDRVIPFEYAGIASGQVSRGLRPAGSPEITLKDAASYLTACGEQGIALDFDKRQATILRQVNTLASSVGGSVPTDEALLAEVTNLVEAPTAFPGAFDGEFLALPREVLVTVMRKHQRYFAVEDSAGELMHYFIGVRNGDGEHLDKVIHGNEQVLRARFSDARFFYEADVKKPLREYLPRLETLTFQAELGSMREKNDRVAGTVDDLGQLLGFEAADVAVAREAAQIAKADLATSMVVEMTSLQGIMGREYALREGIAPEVATAIRDHWLPVGLGANLPRSKAGVLLALADKLDSLVGLLSVGLSPKSTSDPFGLRRTTLGILQILVNTQMSVDLRPLIDRVASSQPVSVDLVHKKQVLNYLKIRLENWFNDHVYVPIDAVTAVLKEQAHNPFRAVQGVDQLATWVKTENWEALLDNFARCVRITRKEPTYSLNPALLQLPEETSLYAAYLVASSRRNESTNVEGFLSAFELMAPAVTKFFDKVLVHAEDVALRNNRIALLQLIAAMQDGKADLSELENF